MPAPSALALRRLVLGAAVLLPACGDSTGPDQPAAGAVLVSAPLTELSVGGTIQLTATVLSPSGATMPDARVTWSSSNTDAARISPAGVLTALAPGTTTITAAVGSTTGRLDMTVWAAACAGPVGATLAPGDAPAGTLRMTDCVFPLTGTPAKAWTLTITQLTRLRITAEAEFMPLVFITGEQFEYITHGGPGDDRRASLLADVGPGTYVVWLATANGQTGTYQVTAEQLPIVPCTRAQIGIGQTVTGTLSPEGCSVRGLPAHFTEEWHFSLDGRAIVRLDAASDDFNTVVLLATADGAYFAFDDHSGEGSNSRLTIELSAGDYIASVTSFDPGGTGSYTLGLTVVDACSLPTAGSAAPGQTVTGTLRVDSCILLEGPVADGWAVTLTEPARIRMTVQSTDFDPIVAVTNTSLVLLGWTSATSIDAAALTFDLPAGTSYIWAGTFGSGHGEYRLTLEQVAAAPCEDVGAITVGQTVTGALSSADCIPTWAAGRFADGWPLTLTRETNLQIDLTSSAFDAFLVVMDSSFAVVGVDDDGGDGTNSRIRITLKPGTYVVWVTSYQPGETGAYQLRVQEVQAAAGAGLRAPAVRELPVPRWEAKDTPRRGSEWPQRSGLRIR